jgi:hypothetical protein
VWQIFLRKFLKMFHVSGVATPDVSLLLQVLWPTELAEEQARVFGMGVV